MTISRIVVVTKQTPYEELLRTNGTHGAAAFVLQSRGEDIESYETFHQSYVAAVKETIRQLPRDITHIVVERMQLPHFLFRMEDLVVAIGPDGLFANLAKYLNDQLVVTVNPNPAVIDGVLMRFSVSEVAGVIAAALAGEVDCESVVLAEAKTNDGQRLLAVNDFLIGRLDHISARYRITYDGYTEEHSSSGVLVATGMGASGWMRSIKNMINCSVNDPDLLLPDDPEWDEARLQFVVREAFPSNVTSTEVLYGSVTDELPLTLVSNMPEGGVVFSDGVPEDSLVFNAGMELKIGIAPERVRLVIA